jgi:hypothetical protein
VAILIGAVSMEHDLLPPIKPLPGSPPELNQE